jgi:hypothetical protein
MGLPPFGFPALRFVLFLFVPFCIFNFFLLSFTLALQAASRPVVVFLHSASDTVPTEH